MEQKKKFPIPFEERRWNVENPSIELEQELERRKEIVRNYSSNSK